MSDRMHWITYGAGVCVGLIIGVLSAPIPESTDSCSVFKIDKRPVTSYVLKPPPAPPVEHIVVKEACVSPRPEPDTQTDLSATDNTRKKTHHRRHRYRRNWR